MKTFKLNVDQNDLNAYAEHLENDYYSNKTAGSGNYLIEFVPGSKYIKVVMNHYGQQSVHSFIVNAYKRCRRRSKFQLGDILKANSWKAPATNFIRGNVINRDYRNTRWVGA